MGFPGGAGELFWPYRITPMYAQMTKLVANLFPTGNLVASPSALRRGND